MLAGLARALRLSDPERVHLHHLAGAPPGPPPGPPREVRQSILDLLHRLPQAAAIVTSATFEVLAWNDLAAALMEDFSALPRRERNLVRRAFLGPSPHGRRLYGVSDADAFARASAQRLRAAAARYPDDPELTGLIEELLAGSEEFARLWASHDVSAEPTLCKTFQHPVVGPVTVNCDVLHITDRDQQVVIYTAAPAPRPRRRCGCCRSSAPSAWTPSTERRQAVASEASARSGRALSSRSCRAGGTRHLRCHQRARPACGRLSDHSHGRAIGCPP